ncbi:MAG: hypothetical protein NTY38_24865 [Acidobacteria bacterium]|nr:hypothetical protein [Acidobacteriota bacterium]
MRIYLRNAAWRENVTGSDFAIQKRIGGSHFAGCSNRCTDLNQSSRSDTGTESGLFGPFSGVFDEFRPEGIEAALGGFGGMNGAAALTKKVAAGMLGNTQTEKMPCPIDVLQLKLLWCHPQEFRGAKQVRPGQVNEAPARTAIGTSGNTAEAECIHSLAAYQSQQADFPLRYRNHEWTGTTCSRLP